MANKPSKASMKGAALLAKNPNATSEEIARRVGLTASAVQKSAWWKNRPAAQQYRVTR